MSNYAWISNIRNDHRLTIMFLNDLCQSDCDKCVESIRAWKRGEPLSQDRCPTKVFPEKGYATVEDGAKLPPVFVAEGFWVVSGSAADILRKHDLGAGALYPVEVLARDRQTPFPGEWFTWVFGNLKDTLAIDESRNLRQFSPVPGDTWRKMPTSPKDGDVALLSAASTGPEVWLEESLFQAIGLSASLGDELQKSGLAKAFRLTKARLV